MPPALSHENSRRCTLHRPQVERLSTGPRRSGLAASSCRARGTPDQAGVRRAFSQLRAKRSTPSAFASTTLRRRGSVTAVAASSLGPIISLGLCRHIACIRIHLERPNWVCLRRCNALVFSSAKASTSALDSHAPYLTAVLGSSVASVQCEIERELVTRAMRVSRKVLLKEPFATVTSWANCRQPFPYADYGRVARDSGAIP